MKKKANTSKPSTQNKRPKKKPYLEYYDLFSFKHKPYDDAFLENLAKELMAWADKEGNLTYRKFLREKGIHNEDFDRFCQRSEPLKRAKEYLFSALADKREIKALEKKYEPGIAKTGMHYYDEEWKKLREWESSLKEKQNQALGSGFKTVEIPLMPKTDIVPEKDK